MPSPAAALAHEPNPVGRLARFFPEATAVRMPIRLSLSPLAGTGSAGGKPVHVFLQNTVIEFGTPREALFMVDRPLEFADRVFVESEDGSLRAEAAVIAVQYQPAHTAVAARFLKQTPNWIVKHWIVK